MEQFSKKTEEEIRKFWISKKIPEKVRGKKEKERFYLMDGPPYATGSIHMGTALNKILKDVAIRSKRMQGFEVFDRAGYDTHGLPIENAVEKELGFEKKNDIEEYGVKKFTKKCREFATQHIDSMNNEFENLGVWMGFENPYLTLSNEYIEAIWWTFKKADEKELLYKGKYSVHVCPRCETAVAYNEIEYVKQTDNAVYVKFPFADKNMKKHFFIIWTTTPWTLPANSGIMVHPKYKYSFVTMGNGETWIIASELVQKLMDAIEAGYTIEKEVSGKELEGIAYKNPLEKNLAFEKKDIENGYRIITNDRYVNLDEGTGLVHTAPGHGKEDFEVGSKAGLPILSPVAINGQLTKKAGKYSGGKARVVDEEIVQDLDSENKLVFKHPYTHDYPVCWRCKSPLLMIATPQWFFRISKIQKKLASENKKVEWTPKWMKDRMGNWIESLGDWPVSRKRYWGTPLPIWICDDCGEKEVIGSVKELSKKASLPKELDLHKPFIDSVEWDCRCGGKFKRVKDVLDVWFDSGVSSWAALGHPSDKSKFKKYWPANLNIEGTDQVRGWWNSQLITSIICFDKKPFESIAVHGMVLDVEKKKMSKSLGNVVQPEEVIEKYNRDYLRWFLVKESRGEDFSFSWDYFTDINRFFNILWNSYRFTKMYLGLETNGKASLPSKLEPEDKWIVSRLNQVSEKIVNHYNSYEFYKIAGTIEEFVIEDLSRTYIKLVRGRTGEEGKKVKKVLEYCFLNLLKLVSPITPHLAEHFYQDMRTGKAPESIHLLEIEKSDKKLVDEKLEQEMEKGMKIVQESLALREQEKLRLRWPLKELVVKSKSGKEISKVKKIVAKSANVKKVSETKQKPKGGYAEKKSELPEIEIFLCTEADEKLKQEWELRELVRRVQDARKKAGLKPDEKAVLEIACSDTEFLKAYSKTIEQETNSKIVAGKESTEMERLLEREFFINIKKSKKS